MKTLIAREIVNARFGRFTNGTERRPIEAAAVDEEMELVDNGDGTWSVRSSAGEWLSIELDGSLGGRPGDQPPGPWERFTRQGNVLIELPKKDGGTRPCVEVVIQ